MTSLAEYLRISGLLASEKLEAARARQQSYGGSLDTVLMELKHIDPETLDRALSVVRGHPSTSAESLESRPDRPWDALPQEVLRLGWVVPLSRAGDALHFAFHPEIPETQLETLKRRLPDASFSVTAECCIAKIAAEHSAAILAPRYALLARAFIDALKRPSPSPEPPAAPWVAPSPSDALHSPTYERLLTQLQATQSRDACLSALTAAALELCSRVALFRIERDREQLRGLSIAGCIPESRGASVPLTAELEASLTGQTPLEAARDLDLRLAVGEERAHPCALLSIAIRDRNVLALYADREGELLDEARRTALRELCDHAARRLAEILLMRRAPAQSSGPESSGPAEEQKGPVPLTRPLPPRPPIRRPPRTTPPGDFPKQRAEPEEEQSASTSASEASEETEDERSNTLLGLKSPAATQPRRDAPRRRTQSPLLPITLVDTGPPSPSSRTPTLPNNPAVPKATPLPKADSSGITSLSSPLLPPSIRGHLLFEDDPEDGESPRLTEHARIEEIDDALDAVQRGDATVESLRPFGEDLLLRVTDRFPGPLDILRRQVDQLPPVAAHGPLIRIVLELGEAMVPYLVELCRHPRAEVRFYATLIFQALRDERCIPVLAERIFDEDPDVRAIAARVLETHRNAPDFQRALTQVREALNGEQNARLQAIRASGTLRDVHAIPQLIEGMRDRDRYVQEASLEALCSVTGQQLGLKPHRWRQWHREHQHQHRLQWLIESLQHRGIAVRRWAYEELTRITGEPLDFPIEGSKNDRDAGIRRWKQWWDERGAQRFSRS